MGILGLLAEIYAMPNLKLNLKFDIEVSLSTFVGQGQLKEILIPNKDVEVSQQQMVGEVKSGTISTLNEVELLLEGCQRISCWWRFTYIDSGLLQRQSSYSVSQLPTPASNIEQQVIVNPKLLCAWPVPTFSECVVPIAMDRAVKEIVSGIVQRSASIATQTTKELDYAKELDETRIRNEAEAAHLMVASLANMQGTPTLLNLKSAQEFTSGFKYCKRTS
ncbi:transcription regulator [Actinidia rufa]|uniref:Transcription regulator n=1 Tax=Actinidia rufa TaxID=165716 RepID=A0A7J0FR59_9ERIC|nr:transcription regulator [Actinidia rufa]